VELGLYFEETGGGGALKYPIENNMLLFKKSVTIKQKQKNPIKHDPVGGVGGR
jgi:hypothetical protein